MGIVIMTHALTNIHKSTAKKCVLVNWTPTAVFLNRFILKVVNTDSPEDVQI